MTKAPENRIGTLRGPPCGLRLWANLRARTTLSGTAGRRRPTLNYVVHPCACGQRCGAGGYQGRRPNCAVHAVRADVSGGSVRRSCGLWPGRRGVGAWAGLCRCLALAAAWPLSYVVDTRVHLPQEFIFLAHTRARANCSNAQTFFQRRRRRPFPPRGC